MAIALPDYSAYLPSKPPKRPEPSEYLKSLVRRALRTQGHDRARLLVEIPDEVLSESWAAGRPAGERHITVDGTRVMLVPDPSVEVRPERRPEAEEWLRSASEAWLKEHGSKLPLCRKNIFRRLGEAGLPRELFNVRVKYVARLRPAPRG